MLELAIGGHYRVVAVHFTPDLATAALLLLPAAAVEELLFRGVFFRLIEEWSGTWIALAVSAAIFGFAHSGNAGATWVSTLAVALEAGVLLAAAFVVAKNLWFPIGIHFAWNFSEGPIYGTQISGHAFGKSALTAQLSGPTLLTGGAFGPEAGLAAMLTCLLAAIALLVLAVARSQVVPANWKMSREL
jgi:membrane protease YdiL (CAAX protease family)